MKKYYVPVMWEVWDKVEVQADSLEEAVKYVKQHEDTIPLGTTPNYIDGSYHVDDGNNGKSSIKETVDFILECRMITSLKEIRCPFYYQKYQIKKNRMVKT